jgi:BNR repeat-like domain
VRRPISGPFGRRSRVAAVAVAVLAAWVLPAPGPEAVAAAPVVVRVSSDPYSGAAEQHRTEVEPDSFAAGSTLVSAFQAGRRYSWGGANIGWATSSDGGHTFESGFLSGITVAAGGQYLAAGDPSVAYDLAHQTWLISSLGVAAPPSVLATELFVSRSPDGLHWSDPVTVARAGPSGGLDKNWTVCDSSRASRFFGHCYTQFMDYLADVRLKVSTSTDGGQTWGPPRETKRRGGGWGGQPVVQRDGTVIVPFLGPGLGDPYIANNFIGSFRSTDGGESWSAPRTISQIAYHPPLGMRAPPAPSAEIDRGGNVYVAWHDCRFRAGCAANDIVVSKSADGLKWSEPTRVSIDSVNSGSDHFIAGLAVDPYSTGDHARLALTHYSYPHAACTPARCRLTVGFITSTDGGASWGKPGELAGPMRLDWLPDTTWGRMVGDYISTSFLHGRAFPFFAVASAPQPDGSFDQAIATAAGGLDATATITVSGTRLTLRRERRTRVRLACPAAEESPPCAGILRLATAKRIRYQGKQRHVQLAAARFRIMDGQTRTIELRLPERKAALVRIERRARSVRAIARLSDAAGNRATVAKTMRLRLGH